MTRINLVDPGCLCDQHLLAELRELPRIPNGVLSGRLQVSYPDAPLAYKLGAGHVKFFVNKLGWLAWRYELLLAEASARGFHIAPRFPAAELAAKIGVSCLQQYKPQLKEISANIERICERMPPAPRYASKGISRQQALELVAGQVTN